MDNPFQAVSIALGEARRLQSAADGAASEAATLIVGRLRHVHSSSTLAAMKKELRNFNIQTGRWAKQK